MLEKEAKEPPTLVSAMVGGGGGEERHGWDIKSRRRWWRRWSGDLVGKDVEESLRVKNMGSGGHGCSYG